MDREAYLLHQVHPAKLATDLSADAVSTWLMWRHRPRAAVVTAHAAAAAASVVVLRRDLSRLATTRRGRYVLTHMPPSAAAVRYLGQLVVWRAAYRRRPLEVVLGHLVVVAGWSHGLLFRGRAVKPSRSLVRRRRRCGAHGCADGKGAGGMGARAARAARVPRRRGGTAAAG